jgi:uncharacterized protein (DUF305 family)
MKLHNALLIGAIVLVACATDTSPSTSNEPPEVRSARELLASAERQAASDGGSEARRCFRFHWVIKDERAPVVPQDDVDLIDAMVPHHEMALMMADMEIADGSSPEVIAVAERMRAMQMDEIAELEAIREQLTGCSTVPRLHDAHHEVDMAALEATEGEARDLAFIEHMIPHHASGISMAHNALANLEHPRLQEIAHMIVESQSAEICELRALRAAL